MLKPISPYASTKVSGELLGYRPSTSYGAGVAWFVEWLVEAEGDASGSP